MSRHALIAATMEQAYTRLLDRIGGLADDALHPGAIVALRDLYCWTTRN